MHDYDCANTDPFAPPPLVCRWCGKTDAEFTDAFGPIEPIADGVGIHPGCAADEARP